MGLFLTPPTKKTFHAAWIIAVLAGLGAFYSPWIGVLGYGLAYTLLAIGVTMVGW